MERVLTAWESATVETEIGDPPNEPPSVRTIGIIIWMPERLRPKVLIPAFFVVLPAIFFYTILFRKALNLPFWDDYRVLLDFLNHMVGLRGTSAKTAYFLAAQFNEYKLFFGHAVGWLQLVVFGHIDFRLLCALGNGFVLLLAILLWKMFLPNEESLARRMALFIPVSWLLFQLRYVETLNWAMPSLQNLPVLVFSLGAIYLLVRPTGRAFSGALVSLILAIASSGNGLFAIPVGVLILALDRRYDRHYSRLAGWLAVSAGSVAAYAYRYNTMEWLSPLHHSAVSTVSRLRPLSVIAFVGNAAAYPRLDRVSCLDYVFAGDVVACLLLGLVLCVFFYAMARRGYIRKNPLVAYCVLFLLLTAVGVAGIRSDFGVALSLSSRYTMYSALLLIFAWFAIVEEFLQRKSTPLRRNRIWLGAVAVSILFSLSMDVAGWRYLTERNRTLILGMSGYERALPTGSEIGPIFPVPNRTPKFDKLYREAPEILRKSTELGIYRPPAY